MLLLRLPFACLKQYEFGALNPIAVLGLAQNRFIGLHGLQDGSSDFFN